jgi:hypothetical protein
MEERATELEAEVAGSLRTAEAADAEEDKPHGPDNTGEEMLRWAADEQHRIEKIRQAKAELEAEAKAAAEAKHHQQDEVAKGREATGRRKGGRTAAPPSNVPDARARKTSGSGEPDHEEQGRVRAGLHATRIASAIRAIQTDGTGAMCAGVRARAQAI